VGTARAGWAINRVLCKQLSVQCCQYPRRLMSCLVCKVACVLAIVVLFPCMALHCTGCAAAVLHMPVYRMMDGVLKMWSGPAFVVDARSLRLTCCSPATAAHNLSAVFLALKTHCRPTWSTCTSTLASTLVACFTCWRIKYCCLLIRANLEHMYKHFGFYLWGLCCM
jgi:hypothetical protein